MDEAALMQRNELKMIHGSRINRTDAVRRIVRVGYRDPENVQTAGQRSKQGNTR